MLRHLWMICRIPISPMFPPNFRAIIDKSTANTQGSRYQTAAEMRVDLERAFEGDFV